MKRSFRILILLTILLSTLVGVLIAQAQGMTPEQQTHSATLGIILNGLTALAITPIVNWLKSKFPVIQGIVTVIVTSLFAIGIVYGYDLVFHIGVWQDATFWQNLVVALGINQTIASGAYELISKKVGK